VLVTSNYHAWRGTAEPVEIRLWPKEIGADYLVARTARDTERNAAEELSVALGGLPLAHEQAAAYCERLDLSLAEYARRFAAEPARLLDTDKDAPAGYHDKLTVAKTFALAIEAAAKLHPAAEPLIVHSALLAPEPIPLFFFAEGREKFGEPLYQLLAGDGLDEAIAALRAFALVDRETILDERDAEIKTDTIRLHRLVREVAAARCTGAAREEARRALIEVADAVYPRRVYHHPAAWVRARRLDALALDLIGGDADPPAGAERLASHLLDRLATYRERSLAAYTEARSLFERALAISEKALGPDDPNTMACLNNLAALLHTQGDFTSARPLFERAVTTTEKLFGPDHPDTATCLSNLAELFRTEGDLVAARPLVERALTIDEAAYGPDHLAVATDLNNLGLLLRAGGDLSAARPLYQRAVAICEKVLGVEHPHTATSLINLALLLQAEGDPAAAQPLLERALAIREKVLGPAHPSTVKVRQNVDAVIAQGS
jgi:tetratricopeptide (TPR) repeat protein